MSDQLILGIINLVAKVGIDAAISVLNGIARAKTVDEAIIALEESSKKTWADYKKEAGVVEAPAAVEPATVTTTFNPNPSA